MKHAHIGAKTFMKLHFKYLPNFEAFTTSEILGPGKIGMRINKNFGPIVK